MKKVALLTAVFGLTLALGACSSSNDSSTAKSSESSVEKASKVDSKKESSSKKAESSEKAASSSRSIPTTDDQDWFYQNNVFYAGKETMTFTKSEVRDGIDDGTKVLVIYNTILNNSDEEQDPSNFYMVIQAKQKSV
ncbi:DUF5067 domain-containing protein [Lapidilactobacillus mulanensis]|uniref:DUF5067 domain-containing protein n=1 Tax=Lapidilactobacillus mulanensis TaxID=2485999 RepID=A0ABW4DLY2_9LACO|nr:DUF5067 domain-containing protein [Lapidilactobacillus mulanensis]